MEIEGKDMRVRDGGRIAVSGVSGFVGRTLNEELVRRGHHVVAVAQADLAAMREGSDGGFTGLAGCDAAIHLAARAHVLRETEADPMAAFRTSNRDSTLAFARACASARVPRFIFVSSIGVNGSSSARPFRPEDRPAPSEPYAISKYEAEQGLWKIAAESGLEVVVIRPPLVYGPGARGNFQRLLKLAALPIPLPLASVAGQRSYVSVWNLCDLLIHCIGHPAAAGGTFLASDGEDISLPQLVAALSSAMGRRARLLPVPESLLRAAARVLGLGATIDKLVSSLQVDSSATRRILEWSPPVSLAEGLSRTARQHPAARSQ